MAKIIASGVPVKYQNIGDIRIIVKGTDVDIEDVTFEARDKDGKYAPAEFLEPIFDYDMKKGPKYPLCADPETMRRALFVLYEWYGEEDLCWIGQPKHVIVEGEIEPMESEPGVVY